MPKHNTRRKLAPAEKSRSVVGKHQVFIRPQVRDQLRSYQKPRLIISGMMAVLVLAHPDDSKFKDVIGRLQIQWMMLLDREAFEVGEGFWQGISDKNLYSVFFAAEARDAISPLVADYGRLFGRDFPDCRRNIVPYLPPWARHITLTTEPSDTERDWAETDRDSDILSDAPSDALSDVPEAHVGHEGPEADGPHEGTDTPHSDTIVYKNEDKSSHEPRSPAVISESDVQTLRERLELHESSPAAEEWLFQTLDNDVGDNVLPAWVHFWEGEINRVENAAAQVITRELFSQSLCKVKSLVLASMLPMANAYMLVDMLDGRLKDVTPSSFSMAKQLLDDFPGYRSYTDAFEKFKSTVESAAGPEANDLLEGLFQMQTGLFHHLTLGTTFFEYWPDVTLFETLRTHILIQDVQDASRQTDPDSDVVFWRSQRDLLLRDETAISLQLTPWQRRALVYPGSGYGYILTPSQVSYFRHKVVQELPSATKDPSLVGLLPLDPTTDLSVSPAERSAVAKYPGLRKLLGALLAQVPEPQQSLPSDRCQTPTTPVRPPSLATSTGINPVPGLSRSVRTPSETACSSRTTWKKRTPSTGVSNIYAGKTSSKRSASPDRRHVKLAKLDWEEELKTEISSLRTESKSLVAEVQGLKSTIDSVQGQVGELGTGNPFRFDINELKAYIDNIRMDLAEVKRITAQADTAELKTDITNIQAGLEELKSNTVHADMMELREGVNNIQMDLAELPRTNAQTDIAKLKTGVEAEVAALRASNIRIQKEMIELKTSIHGLGPSLIQTTKSQVTGLVSLLQTEIKGLLVAPEKTPPALGEDGFLSHRCPAPPGWNQREYESELERAALSYICLHGRPDVGFGEDEDCLQEILERFPSLDQTHIASTLQHVHMRVYHRPIGNQGSLEDNN